MKTEFQKINIKTVCSLMLWCLMLTLSTHTKASIAAANAQQSKVTIRGIVLDKKGEPLIGVSILEKGTKNAAVTEMDGQFTIAVSNPHSTLTFSYVGFRKEEIQLNGNKYVQVTLSGNDKILDEVVVIGYGTQRKGDVTSAIVSVKSEDFTTGKISDAAELIKGKVAGLSITKSSGDPNTTSNIMLRGISTLYGGVQPLILVDGIEGSLTSVSVENIQSIDVLKDASAAAIYGTRGANGVIIITTKSGKRESRSEVAYSSYLSFSNWYKTADFMDTKDVIYANTNFPYEGYDTDWLKAVTRKAGYTQNHSLELRGGSSTSAYSANITYYEEEGIMRKSDNQNLKMQLDYSQYAINDIIKFNVNLLYGRHKNTNNNNAYVYRQALIRNPSSPIYNEDGTYYEEYSRFQYYNPVAIQNELIGDTRSHYARLTGKITLEPIKGWQTEWMASLKENSSTGQTYYSSNYYSQKIAKIKGWASKSSGNGRSDNMDITSRYNFSSGKHRATGLVGYSYIYNVYDGFAAGNGNFSSESFLYNNIGEGSYLKDKDHTASMSSYKNDNTLVGFFGRVSYSFADRYNVLAAVRREGSSVFGEDNKWGTFPSLSLGWSINNEKFMKQFTWINNLKLRAGYGKTGVNAATSYNSLTMFNFDPYGYHLNKDGQWTSSLYVVQNPNPKLKWETTQEINLGLDWSIWNDRFSGSIDVYNKKTRDLLFKYAVPVPPNMYGSTLANVGKMRNRGIELLIKAVPVTTKDFEYNSTLTLSHNSNKLLSLSNDLYETDNFQEVGGLSDPVSVPTHAIEVGHSMGDFWGLKSVGVSKNGVVLVEVLDGNGGWDVKEFDSKYNEKVNRQRLGNGLPQVYAGWGHTLRYKNIDLSVQFTGQFGFHILNAQRVFYENNSIAYNRLKSATKLYGAVEQSGEAVIDPNTGKQKQVRLSNSMAQGFWSDHIEKGDFIKLSSLTLGYNLPLSGTVKQYMKRARVYLSGQNLFCITSYSGLDPEVSNYFMYPGIDDRDKYPTTRSFTIGVNVNF